MEPEPRKPSTSAQPRRSAFVHSVRTIRIVMCAPNLSYRVSTSRSVALAEPTSGTLQNTSPYSPLSSQLGYACSSRMRGHTARQNRATHSVAHSSLPGCCVASPSRAPSCDKASMRPQIRPMLVSPGPSSYRPWAPRFQSELHNPPTRWRRRARARVPARARPPPAPRGPPPTSRPVHEECWLPWRAFVRTRLHVGAQTPRESGQTPRSESPNASFFCQIAAGPPDASLGRPQTEAQGEGVWGG